MTRRSLLAVAFVLICSTHDVHAAPITFYFSGSVTQVNFDPADPFAGAIQFGTAFSGTFVFESTSPDSLPADAQSGSYFSNAAPSQMMINIGGRVFTVTGFLNIGVANDYSGPVDQYTVLAKDAQENVVLELFLQDNTATVFTSDSLPVSLLNRSSFLIARLTLTARDIDGDSVEILGDIDSLAFPPPTVTGISPHIAESGSRVTITGSGFFGPVQVFFDGVPGAVEVVDESTLIVTLPALPPGSVDVTVTAAGGSVVAPPNSLFIVSGVTAPTLSEAGLLLLVLILLAISFNRLRRKSAVVSSEENDEAGGRRPLAGGQRNEKSK